jgi:hypothetical protein
MSSALQPLRQSLRQSGRTQALVFALLTLFVLQVAVLRGHVHTGTTTAAIEQTADASAPSGNKHAPAHNEADCPLWHASGVCGTALAPTAVVGAQPLARFAKSPLDERAILYERFTAAWRSRAPPSA